MDVEHDAVAHARRCRAGSRPPRPSRRRRRPRPRAAARGSSRRDAYSTGARALMRALPAAASSAARAPLDRGDRRRAASRRGRADASEKSTASIAAGCDAARRRARGSASCTCEHEREQRRLLGRARSRRRSRLSALCCSTARAGAAPPSRTTRSASGSDAAPTSSATDSSRSASASRRSARSRRSLQPDRPWSACQRASASASREDESRQLTAG